MSVVLGKDVKIFAGSSGTTPLIALAKNCTLTTKCDLIEKASATQGTAKEYLAGREEWEVSIGHLVTSDAPFDAVIKRRQTYTLRIVIAGVTKQGTAICTQAELNAPVGSLATGSVKFKGTGALT